MPQTKEEYAAYQRGWRKRWRLKNPEKAKQMNRGVLCEPCNLRLGWFENRREAILKYLGE